MSRDMSARIFKKISEKEGSKICQGSQKILVCLTEIHRECLGKNVEICSKTCQLGCQAEVKRI